MRSSTSTTTAGLMEMRLSDEVSRMESGLERRQRTLDEVNDLSRRTIRECARSITALHNSSAQEAESHLKEARAFAAKLGKLDSEFRYISVQAYQELAEAEILREIKASGRIPSPAELGLPEDAYLLGLMDVVGELKRSMLLSLMKGDVREAGGYFSFMQEIYDSTRGIRFPESVLPMFRKKQDTARIQLENAGSDLLKFSKARTAATIK